MKNAGDVNLSLNLSSVGQEMNDYDQDGTEVITLWLRSECTYNVERDGFLRTRVVNAVNPKP